MKRLKAKQTLFAKTITYSMIPLFVSQCNDKKSNEFSMFSLLRNNEKWDHKFRQSMCTPLHQWVGPSATQGHWSGNRSEESLVSNYWGLLRISTQHTYWLKRTKSCLRSCLKKLLRLNKIIMYMKNWPCIFKTNKGQ